jgi:hypothetical protein
MRLARVRVDVAADGPARRVKENEMTADDVRGALLALHRNAEAIAQDGGAAATVRALVERFAASPSAAAAASPVVSPLPDAKVIFEQRRQVERAARGAIP